VLATFILLGLSLGISKFKNVEYLVKLAQGTFNVEESLFSRKLIGVITITFQNMAFTVTLCRWFRLLRNQEGQKTRSWGLFFLLTMFFLLFVLVAFLSRLYYKKDPYIKDSWINSLAKADAEIAVQTFINCVFILCHLLVYKRVKDNLSNYLL